MATSRLFLELKETLKDLQETGQKNLMALRGTSDNMQMEAAVLDYDKKIVDADNKKPKSQRMPENSRWSNSTEIANSAAKLKEYVTDMLEIRNGKMDRTRATCPLHRGTYCEEHKYSNYSSLMKAVTGMDNPMSSGDVYRAIPYMTYCSCNVRFAGGCSCNNRRKMDGCQCYQRSPSFEGCDCKSRSIGKYDAWYIACACYARTVPTCDCLSRSTSPDCECNVRCACDARKEFSYRKYKNDNCLCNEKSVPGCECNTVRLYHCASHFCQCFARENAHCQAQVGGTSSNYVERCPSKACSEFESTWARCRDHGPSYQIYSKCDINVGESYSYFDGPVNSSVGHADDSHYYDNYRCSCQNRCGCHTKAIMVGDTSVKIDNTVRTSCNCNMRGSGSSGFSGCTCVGQVFRDSTYTYDSEGAASCSCDQRIAKTCDCNHREVCICVYRTTAEVIYKPLSAVFGVDGNFKEAIFNK